MPLNEYLQIIRQYWRSTVATILVCIALAAGVTLLQSPTYTSQATVFLTVASGDSASDLSQGASYSERTVTSYVQVATTEVVLQPVIEELGLDTTPAKLAEDLSISAPSSTSLITIQANAGDAEDSAVLANAVAQSLLNAVEDLSPQSSSGEQLVSASTINTALPPSTPTSPNPLRNLALGLALGLLLGFGQALGRSLLDTRVRTTRDIEQVTELPVLASINSRDAAATRGTDISQWANAEAYRRLRTNIGFVGLGGERRSSMVVTSATEAEGKTETAVNLARVLAQAGENVLLVDADLRRPQVAARMSLDAELGLSDVLTGRGTLEDLTIEVFPTTSRCCPPAPSRRTPQSYSAPRQWSASSRSWSAATTTSYSTPRRCCPSRTQPSSQPALAAPSWSPAQGWSDATNSIRHSSCWTPVMSRSSASSSTTCPPPASTSPATTPKPTRTTLETLRNPIALLPKDMCIIGG